ncbi:MULTISPECIES: hypothetical protein [Mycobacteriaceae]|nr:MULTISPECIES: hypothetical protein [Mycobacteriaceae]KAB7760170.1 hypothetical protein MMUC44124_08935 [Mycolicibacterium mucogenicum DSM 44124]
MGANARVDAWLPTAVPIRRPILAEEAEEYVNSLVVAIRGGY